jgi:hypothetical protein
MIGGAVLPSLPHQDSRYYYQGTGTAISRFLHVISAMFMAKGDNGHWQPNYSGLGSGLASAAISNAYYPAANRGVALTFENLGTDLPIHAGACVLEEFLFHPPH